MKCEKCKKEIKNPLLKCPYCGVDIPEYARALARKETSIEKEHQDALTRKKWKKTVILSILTWVIGILVVYPVTFYFGLKYEWYWLPILGIGLVILVFFYIGFSKGAFLCPFCGNMVGKSMGKYCPHCRTQIRD